MVVEVVLLAIIDDDDDSAAELVLLSAEELSPEHADNPRTAIAAIPATAIRFWLMFICARLPCHRGGATPTRFAIHPPFVAEAASDWSVGQQFSALLQPTVRAVNFNERIRCLSVVPNVNTYAASWGGRPALWHRAFGLTNFSWRVEVSAEGPKPLAARVFHVTVEANTRNRRSDGVIVRWVMMGAVGTGSANPAIDFRRRWSRMCARHGTMDK